MTLLSRDQYQRAICRVHYRKGLRRLDLSEELLQRGLATVYRHSLRLLRERGGSVKPSSVRSLRAKQPRKDGSSAERVDASGESLTAGRGHR